MRRADRGGATPLDGVDLLLADLDGVVYAGADAIPHAVEALGEAQRDRRVAYITNNASRTDAAVAAQLRGFGLEVAASDVVTSPQAAMALLTGLVAPGSRILVVGGEGLTHEVERAGFTVPRSADDDPAAVVQGFAPEVGWAQLAEASYALAARDGQPERPWIATNTDWTIPQARGIAPGNGTLVSAVHTAIGRLPIVAGKPERAIFDAAVARFGASHPLFIGDRLDTDIAGATAAGMPSVLVMTGIDGPKQVLAAAESMRPTFLLGDLRGLHRPYPEQTDRQRRGRREFGSADAVVTLRDSAVRLERAGSERIDTLRAGAAAVWGSGLPIYALDIDPALYSDA